MLILVNRIDRELHALKSLELKFWPKIIISECFDKIPEMFLFDVPFRVFRFSKASFYRGTQQGYSSKPLNIALLNVV